MKTIFVVTLSLVKASVKVGRNTSYGAAVHTGENDADLLRFFRCRLFGRVYSVFFLFLCQCHGDSVSYLR